MIIFYNKNNNRFVGTLDAPINSEKIKIIPGGFKKEDIGEISITKKQYLELVNLKKEKPIPIKIKLNDKKQLIDFEYDGTGPSFEEIKQQKIAREEEISRHIAKIKDKNQSPQERLDSFSKLIDLRPNLLK